MRRLFVGLLVLSAACQDEPRSPTTPRPGTTAAFFLTVSNGLPVRGSTITVTANAAALPGGNTVGSFTAQLNYDSAGLRFVAESRLPHGMRAVNAQPGQIRVAGASSDGLGDGHLFAVTFTVLDPKALASLELVIDELNGSDFSNQLPSDPRQRTTRFVPATRQ
jgi:hypothetical protein